jgi:fucose permease
LRTFYPADLRPVSGLAQTLAHNDNTHGPAAVWLAAGFLLAGIGTVMLGPLLPTIAAHWQLTDAASGSLLAAKFFGSFVGGVSVPRRIRLGILSGMAFACVGFSAFAFSTGLISGCLALSVGGFGLGQIIASTNILAGHRYRAHTGSALASLNFFWSLGAVTCGLLVAALLPHVSLRNSLLGYAALFLAVGLGGSFSRVGSEAATQQNSAALPKTILIRFALLLFLYGGLETCLTGWVTTFTLRFSDVRLLGGQSAVVLLWGSLTAGRALSSAAMRWLAERTVQRIGLAVSALVIAVLATARHSALMSICCVVLGLSLAPFFPSTFALLMKRNPLPRVAGFILAVSGLGAALFPWLMGQVSTASGSLRLAMLVPMLLALALLLLSLLPEPLLSGETLPKIS